MSIENSISALNNLPVHQIIEEFGSPLYLYNGEKIEHQYQRLTKAFSNVDVKIKYALKASNNLSILKLLLKHGAGLDAVSFEEVQLGMLAGFHPSSILFTP